MKSYELTERDWDLFFKALSAAIPAVVKQYADITDKSMLGNYSFKIAYAVVLSAKDKNFTNDPIHELRMEDLARELAETDAKKPKNFGRA